MYRKHLKLLLVSLVCLSLLLFVTQTAQAQSILPACVYDGRCTLCDIMQVFINFGKFLLGIVGSLALLMFVYGGFVWLSSGGESGKIEAGKKILVNSVIGIGITFFAWVVVSFVVTTLTQSTGWNWNIQLTCAPLPTLPPVVLENRWTDDTTSNKKKDGEDCDSKDQCEGFCSKITQEIKANVYDDSKGTIKLEANKCHAKLPDYAECEKNIAYGDDDTLACNSGECNIEVGQLNYCQPASSSGQLGSPCYSKDVCKGWDLSGPSGLFSLYCNTKTHQCERKKMTGEKCDELGVDDDDLVCISKNCPYGLIDYCICKSNDQCPRNMICDPEPPSGFENQKMCICTNDNQCPDPQGGHWTCSETRTNPYSHKTCAKP